MGEGEGPQKGVHLQTRPDVLDQVLARRVAGTTSRAVAGNTRTRSGCCDCARGTSSAACRSRRRWVGCDSTRPPQTSETSTASTSGRARPTWSAGSGCTCAVLRLSSSGAHHHAGRQALHRPAAEGRGRHGTGQPPAGHPEADVLAGHLGRQAVRLDVRTTKNTEGREFPFDVCPELRDMLEQQRDYTKRVEQARGQIVPWVFHRDTGQRVRSLYGSWRSACRKAGSPWRIPHDFRRTAVRNLVRACVPERVAMMLTGHKLAEAVAVTKTVTIRPSRRVRRMPKSS